MRSFGLYSVCDLYFSLQSPKIRFKVNYANVTIATQTLGARSSGFTLNDLNETRKNAVK